MNETTDADEIIRHLNSIKVEPFRGFAKEANFDLSSLLVLVYGPNGTGKSSFCEALEYGLLGAVEETQYKRFKKPTRLLKKCPYK